MNKKIVFSLAFVLFVSNFVFAASAKQYFTVEADAVVKAKPDSVVITAVVISKGKNLAETKRRNSEIIKNSIDYCKKEGIADKDIRTNYINIRPEYKNYDTLETYFVVEQSLAIIIEDLSKYDSVLTQLLNLGINKVNDISFKTGDLKKYRNEARKLAIAAAKERAQFLAGEVGVKLGDIVNMSDYGGWYPTVGNFANANIISQNVSQRDYGGWQDSSDILAPGMISVKAGIVLTYEILKK